VLFCTPLWGQNCSELVQDALSSYELGDFNKALTAVSSCVNSENLDDRWSALRVQALAHLALGNSKLATEAAREMKALQPTYKPDVLSDPKELRVLLDGIYVIPKFILGVNLNYGTNWSFPRILGEFNPTSSVKNYNSEFGHQFGFNVGYNFSDKHGVELGLYQKSLRFSTDFKYEGVSIETEEELNNIALPVLYRFTLLDLDRFVVTAKAGGYGLLRYSSYNDFKRYSPEGSEELVRYTSDSRRNLWNYGITGGLGLWYKLRVSHFSVDLLYNKGLTNITRGENRYDNSRLIYNYYYLDDDLQIDDFSVVFGYHLYLNYKVK